MKINLIPTYQQGGVYAPPFAVYQALPTVDQSNKAAPTASSSNSKDLTDEDTLKMLEKLDGLPSDMRRIVEELQNFEIDKAHSSSIAGRNSNVAVRYLGILNDLKVANFNKKEYDNAYEQVSKNGGINEFAINDRGQFVCTNGEGDFKFMTAEELKKSDGSYSPLTNSELLYYRAQDVSLANNNRLLSVVQNGIGIETVTDMIQKAITNLGTQENSTEGYVSTKKGRVIQGLDDFTAAVQEAAGNTNYDGTVNDLYKYKFLSKDQAENAKAAFNYIYSTLPANAKALLKAKSDLTEEGAQKLVQTLIASKLDNTQHFEVELEGGVSAKTTKDALANGKDTTNLKNTQLIEIMRDTGGIAQPLMVDRGDGIQMSVLGRQFNLLVDLNGKPLEDTSIANMLAQTGIQSIVKNMRNITFGDQKVDPEALKNITYNNTGVERAILPINDDGSVNLSLLDAYEQMEARLDALGRPPTEQELQDALKEAGLTDLLRADGTPDPNKFGVFLVTEGYTTDALSGITSSDFVQEYTGDVDAAINVIKSSLTVGSGKDKVEPKVDKFTWYHPGDWFGLHDTIYKAAIYIPIEVQINTAARIDKQNLDVDEAMVYEGMYQNKDKTLNYQSSNSSVLNNPQ